MRPIIHNIKKISTLSVILMLSGFTAFAQQPQQVREDFSEDELEAFVETNNKIATIEQNSQQDMIKAIEDEGLSVERFNQMAQSQQNPDVELNATESELNSFNMAAQKIMQQRQEVQKEVISLINEDDDIDVQTYQAIMIAYQQSPKVKSKVDKIIQEEVD